ncbi:MAG: hypothetical protein IKF68_05160 [Erysipelotrichaceae bacterium]|nr:hypothetical protein [Erysipelotrichaceae bacterium]
MLNVYSETGKLKKVLLHRPGRELSVLDTSNFKDDLFDEIPDPEGVVKEHDIFADILRNKDVRDSFIKDYLKQADCSDERFYRELSALTDERKLIDETMSGLNGHLQPLPNLYFSRDAFTIIGDGIALYNMNSRIRRREVIYGDYLNRYHPAMKGPRFYETSFEGNIEGGDVEILSSECIVIGVSERTGYKGAELLAHNLISHGFRYVLLMKIPSQRSCMHLDTVFTRIDHRKFVIYEKILKTVRLRLISADRSEDLSEGLEAVLAKLLHIEDITLLKCDDETEQWNDACNALCIEPNRIIVYDINEKMNSQYLKAGIEIIKLPSKELLKGRGGAHCMSMPLYRE